MELKYISYDLKFKHPFGVSKVIRDYTPAVLLQVKDKDVFGYGEACLPQYLGEKREDAIAFIQELAPHIRCLESKEDVEVFLSDLAKGHAGQQATKAALSIAFNDLFAKQRNEPFYIANGLPEPKGFTSCTIGIEHDEKVMECKLREAEAFKILKVKLGAGDDKATIELIRKYSQKPIYADANQGWKDLGYAMEMLDYLNEKNVIMVEQPMPVSLNEEMTKLKQVSKLPLIADESFRELNDLKGLKDLFHGVNIKLMKCGGVETVRTIIDSCRQLNMKVMLGCMAESSCAATAMAQFMSLADFVDLDAPYLINNDPFTGIRFVDGDVVVPKLAGMGVTLRDGYENLFE